MVNTKSSAGTELQPSDIAPKIRDALIKHFDAAYGAACLAEMSLPNNRRADLVVLFPKGEIWIIEIKSCRADFEADTKWPEYQDYCDGFSFATLSSFPDGLIPSDVGHMVTDGFDVFPKQPMAIQKLAPARRKVITLRFAMMAGRRLTLAQGLGLPNR